MTFPIRMKCSLRKLGFIAVLLTALTGCQDTGKTPLIPNQQDLDPELLDSLESQEERQLVVVWYDDLEPESDSQALPALKRAPQLYAEQSSKRLAVQQGSSYSYVDTAIVYAQHVANLVQGTPGHWAELRPVSAYQAGDAFAVKHSFYVGSSYDHPIPAAMIDDIMQGANFSWLGYNIWSLDKPEIAASLSQLGLRYDGLIAAYTPSEAAQSYNTIEYHNYDFKKQLESMDMVAMSVLSPTVMVYAWAKNPQTERLPYALKTGNFWYLADMPFVYVYERDRYLVFADLVPLMLGYDNSCEPRAIIRVEDVSPNDSVSSLARVFNLLSEEQIPFGVATIAKYENQPGKLLLSWADNPAALAELLAVQSGYGQILLHGYTHSYPGLPNPLGISGVDWEFWDITTDSPIAGLTAAMAAQRVKDGRDELLSYGLWPRAWVTPHYAADPDYYKNFKEVFWRYFERRTLKSGNTVVGQFFPYPVRDINNRALVLPENTNFISEGNLLPDILETARANLAMRCPWIGTFFHPFLLNPDYLGVNAISPEELKAFFAEIRALGYTYVSISSVRRNPIR